MAISRTITQDELIELIVSHIESGKQFTNDFNWSDHLSAKGFKPEFKHIDFDIIHNALKAKFPTTENCLSDFPVWENGSFSKFNFEHCKNIRFKRKCRFEKCNFDHSSFTHLPPIQHSIFNDCSIRETEFNSVNIQGCTFTRVNMDKCKLINSKFIMINSQEKSFHITDSEFISCTMQNVNGLCEADFSLNRYDVNFSCRSTKWDSLCNDDMIRDKIKQIGNKPIIIMLYAPDDGVSNANKMIEFYGKNGLQLVLVSPQKGNTHPVFEKNNLISGIILPGGPDIPLDDKNTRKGFEIWLLDLGCLQKIPVLGICRGHQLIGSRFGGMIQDVNNHQGDVIHVKPKEGSLIYQRLSAKYKKFEKNNDNTGVAEKTYLSKGEDGAYTYYSSCAHGQMVFFDKNRDKSKVKIVAKSSDNVPEALQINDHIITYQHHHESYLISNPDGGKVAKALLRVFASMVKTYYETHTNDRVYPLGSLNVNKMS